MTQTVSSTVDNPSFALTRPVHVEAAHLSVADLDSVGAFYQKVLGLGVLDRTASGMVLGTGRKALLTLTTRGDAARQPRNAAGLFHNAFLLPDRSALADWFAHAVSLGVSFEGASDHLVSEAIYLSDPEGNGIEVYRDRRPEEWTYHGDGTVEMATHRLDLHALHAEAKPSGWQHAPNGTALGHIHLQVGSLPEADRFYEGVLGLKKMASYPGASFFASGAYHHHVAANIWNSRNAMARDISMTGLQDYHLSFTDDETLRTTLDRLDALEIPVLREDGVHRLVDPWGIGIRLSRAAD